MIIKIRRVSSNPIDRVAFFLPRLTVGGAEKVTVTLLKAFADIGRSCDLIIACSNGQDRIDIPKGVRVIALNKTCTALSMPYLVKYIASERPTAIFSALHSANAIAIIANLFCFNATKVVASVHTTIGHLDKSTKPLKWRIMTRLMLVLANRAHKIIAVSQGVAQDLKKLHWVDKSKIMVVYNPVDKNDIWRKSLEDVRINLFDDNNLPLVVAVGRLVRAKDYPTLLGAFYRLRKRLKCNLLILGEGKERPFLEQRIQEHGLVGSVAMPGLVNNPYKYMSKGNVFVLSSQWEGLPTVLIEALIIGVPVIATDCHSGPSEILDNGKLGKLVPVGDCERLAEEMYSTISCARRNLDQSALRDLEAHYDPTYVANKYLCAIK